MTLITASPRAAKASNLHLSDLTLMHNPSAVAELTVHHNP